MYNNHIPLYFFPTTTAFLDDEPNFLENIKFQLENPNNIEVFSSYKKFEEYYKENSNKVDLQYIELEDSYEDDSISLNVKLAKIKDIRNVDNKNKLLTVVVVDYNMPLLNGLEVAKCLPSHIYKILLTGVADENIAVKAFNSRLINQFIRKQSKIIVEQLNDQIKLANERYFLEESNKIMPLVRGELTRYSLVGNAMYRKIWTNLVKEYNFIEGYIIDISGSYLFYDRLGNDYCFIVQTEEQAEANIDTIPTEEFSEEIISNIRQKTMLYVVESKNYMLKYNILDAIKVTSGNKTFYYGLGKNQYESN